MAATNKCLAQSNKSRTGFPATNKRRQRGAFLWRCQLAESPLRGLSAAGLHRRNDERLMKAQPINPQPGRRLREIRECRGMSQGRLARALGVSVGTIQSYEDGRTHITLDRLLELAPALQCEPVELLVPPGSPPPRYRRRATALPAGNC